MVSQTVLEAIKKAIELRDFTTHNLPETIDTRNRETMLAAGLLDLAYEHLTTMLELLSAGKRIGSAIALARPAVEACYRMHYLLVHEGDALAEAIFEGNVGFLSLGPTMEDVERHYQMVGLPDYFNVLKQHLKLLNEMTHGGRQQILCRFNPLGQFGATYRQETLVDIIRSVTSYYMIAATALSQVIAERNNISNDGAKAISEALKDAAKI